MTSLGLKFYPLCNTELIQQLNVCSNKRALRWRLLFNAMSFFFLHANTLTQPPYIKCFNHKTRRFVLWQLRQVILSGEECHCNSLMLLSHPHHVWVSVPALIYTETGWRKWIFPLWMCEASHKRFYNAFTTSAEPWLISNQSSFVMFFPSPLSHSP